MYLNTTRKIKKTLVNGSIPELNSVFAPINPRFDTQDTHLGAGTPEYKLNSGFRVLKTHTFSCTGGIL